MRFLRLVGARYDQGTSRQISDRIATIIYLTPHKAATL